MIKKENGVTLVALVIMVIVITILATIATYTGISTYQDMQVTAFIKRLETVEERVRTLAERAKVDSDLKGRLEGSYGEEISSIDAYDKIKGKGLLKDKNDDNDINDQNYRYFTNENIKTQLGISDIEGGYIINFNTLEVYSEEGVEYNGNIVYSISEIRQ